MSHVKKILEEEHLMRKLLNNGMDKCCDQIGENKWPGDESAKLATFL